MDISTIYFFYPLFLTLLLPISAITGKNRIKKGGRKVILGTLFLVLPLVFSPILKLSIDFVQFLSILAGLLLFSAFIHRLTFMALSLFGKRVLSLITSVLSGIVILLFGLLNNFFNGNPFLSDIAVFSALIMLFYIIEHRFKWKKLILPSALLMISFLFPAISLDMTSSRVYSLSEYTEDIIENSDSEFSFEYYFSDKHKDSINFRSIVSYILKINTLKNSRVGIFSGDSYNDYLRKLGVSNSQGNLSLLVVKYKNRYHIIPNINNVQDLEFEILKVLRFLKDNGLPLVGIYLGDRDLSEENFSIMKSFMAQNFSPVFISPYNEIPHNISTLIVIGSELVDTHEIGHFLSDGGNILFADTGLKISENITKNNSELYGILKHIGVFPEPFFVVDNRESFYLNSVGISTFTGFYTSPVVINSSNFKPILTTLNQSWLVDIKMDLDGYPESRFPIAAYGEGSYSSFFGVASPKINRVIVLGNTLSLTDYLYANGIVDSYNFIVEQIYILNGDSEMVEIKNKAGKSRL